MDPRHVENSSYSKIIMILLEELTLIKHIYIKHFSISIKDSLFVHLHNSSRNCY